MSERRKKPRKKARENQPNPQIRTETYELTKSERELKGISKYCPLKLNQQPDFINCAGCKWKCPFNN